MLKVFQMQINENQKNSLVKKLDKRLYIDILYIDIYIIIYKYDTPHLMGD